MDEEDCAWLRLVDGVVCEIWRSVRHFASSDQERMPRNLEEKDLAMIFINKCSVSSWLFKDLYYGLVISYKFLRPSTNEARRMRKPKLTKSEIDKNLNRACRAYIRD